MALVERLRNAGKVGVIPLSILTTSPVLADEISDQVQKAINCQTKNGAECLDRINKLLQPQIKECLVRTKGKVSQCTEELGNSMKEVSTDGWGENFWRGRVVQTKAKLVFSENFEFLATDTLPSACDQKKDDWFEEKKSSKVYAGLSARVLERLYNSQKKDCPKE